MKNEKWQIENSETYKISKISEMLFQVYLFPSFRFCPIAKIENSDIKISEFFEFSTWPSIDYDFINRSKSVGLPHIVYIVIYLKGHSKVWDNFLAIESPLETVKNAFYFTSKAIFVLRIFKFFSWFFWSCNTTAWLERLGWFQISWRDSLLTKSCNPNITQYLKKQK